jgi:hypothetical protein
MYMAHVMLRPDLKTMGGEVNDILINDKYCGNLVLAYREGHRMSGSVQLDKSTLSPSDKEKVKSYLQSYVQQLIDALRVKECDVIVTYSRYDHIIATDTNVGVIRNFLDDTEDLLMSGDEDILGDDYNEDPQYDDYEPDRDIMEMNHELRMGTKKRAHDRVEDIEVLYAGNGHDDTLYYELVIVGESRNRVEYHVYDKHKNWVAEAFCKIYGPDVFGEVHWTFNPSDEEIDAVTDLLVSDFDSNEIDTFVINMTYEGEIMDTVELTHEELLDEHELELELEHSHITDDDMESDEYTIVLARDDGDMLTYEIYEQNKGGLPIGTATVDISRRQLSGFIDFRDQKTDEDREYIAMLLMQELDKEKEYETLNLTMLHQNRPIDEILFESEHVH